MKQYGSGTHPMIRWQAQTAMRQIESEPSNALPLKDAALQYAVNCWPVFPLMGKIPLKESRGYKDATTDPGPIHAWWTQHPTANIGLATGKGSGVLVLDMDMPEGYFHLKELQRRYEPLPDTRRTRTAHKGLHYFFEYPTDGESYASTVGLAGLEGIDIRANGGYVVLPPSKLYGKLAYTWADPETPLAPAPLWLVTLIREARQQKESIPQGGSFASSPGEYWLAQAVGKAQEGNRNAVGFWMACQLRDDNVPEPEARRIGLLYANLAPQGKEQYTSKEILASVRSAYKRPPREPARRTHP